MLLPQIDLLLLFHFSIIIFFIFCLYFNGALNTFPVSLYPQDFISSATSVPVTFGPMDPTPGSPTGPAGPPGPGSPC